MKLDKELYTKHAKRLSAILNEKSTFVPYLAKADFVKVLSNSLNTLYAVEKKLTNVELAAKYSTKNLVKEFNKLGKNTFKIDEKFKYDDESDLIDNINYLHMYCKNIFKVDLDDLVEGKDVKASNPKVELRSRTDVEDMPNLGVGMNMGEMGAFGNPFVMGQAYAKVKQDMASGKLYTYSSKPKSVVIAKIISCVTISLAIIGLIVAAIFAIMSANYQVIYTKSGGGTEQAGLQWNATGAGVMYILIACFGAYPLYLTIKGIITKNDNLKYYFSWPWILIFIILALLFVMPDMRVTWLLTADKDVKSQPAQAKMAFETWKIMYIVALSLIGLCVAPMVIGAVCNPKQNKGLIEKTLQQYANEMMGQYGSPSATDVQKPVDVKKPEKEDKKPKSGSKSKK